MLIVPPCRRSQLSPEFARHKCSSAMKLLTWPLSWLPSQLIGIKSLILYGLDVSAGPAESVWMALEMPADCIQSASSQTRCKECAHLLPDMLLQRHHVCCGGHTCLPLCDCCCCLGSPGLTSNFACDGALTSLRYHDKCNSILWQP